MASQCSFYFRGTFSSVIVDRELCLVLHTLWRLFVTMTPCALENHWSSTGQRSPGTYSFRLEQRRVLQNCCQRQMYELNVWIQEGFWLVQLLCLKRCTVSEISWVFSTQFFSYYSIKTYLRWCKGFFKMIMTYIL